MASRRVQPEPVRLTIPIVSEASSHLSRSISLRDYASRHSSLGYLYRLHRRYWTTENINSKTTDLLIARLLSILIWLCVIVIELLTYGDFLGPSVFLHFLFAAADPWKDIAAIIYASGAATYGVSFEIYFIVLFNIANCVFAIKNCGIGHGETISSGLFLGKMIGLFIATELSHQNFKRFTYQQSYRLNCLSATRAMLRQVIYLTVTIMFLVAPGLRAIYYAVQLKCPYIHETTANNTYCSVIDMSHPNFPDDHSCVSDFVAMMVSYEQLRIIRDIALFSIAFYSMYNKAFLDITGMSGPIHKFLLVGFAIMSSSYIAANVDPFQFMYWKLAFSLFEYILISLIILLLSLNLRKKCQHRNELIMEATPTIFG